MYCRKCGKFVYEGGDICADCRLETPPTTSKKPSSGLAFSIACLAIGLFGCLMVWLPYMLSLTLEDVVADIAQNGYGEGNMGVTGVTFIFTIVFGVASLALAVGSTALGVVSIVSSVRAKADDGKRFVISIVLSVIGFLLAIFILVICSLVAHKLIVLFA